MLRIALIQLLLLCISLPFFAQTNADPGLLTIDRIFASPEFRQESAPDLQWINGGDYYVLSEKAAGDRNRKDLVKYDTKTRVRSLFIASNDLIPPGESVPLAVEKFTLSPDESKVLIFTNSSRVWRSNTKGDYWVFDRTNHKLSRLGAGFPGSSLMFAKFSNDNRFVAYVHNFNLYKEDFTDGTVTQLTFDGNGDIINGTFDWVYEEEFSCRDGFRWNTSGSHLAFWQLDASQIGTFYMINNTDSVYSTVIPVQYPKAGQSPSACKVGIISTPDATITWIPVPGDARENYLPRMQWISNELLLVQQINRRQNNLKFYTYNIKTRELKNIYEEQEETFVEIAYPDISADDWEMEDLIPVNTGQEVLRLSETGGWRHLVKINLYTGNTTNLTPGQYDVARFYAATDRYAYFNASPANSTQRYLYRVSLTGKGDTLRLTPPEFAGVNLYLISPNGMVAIHTHSNSKTPETAQLISIPGHKTLRVLAANEAFREKIRSLAIPSGTFFSVTTADGVSMDGFMSRPPDFDPGKKYPVLFYVYGEPWEQVAIDKWPDNLWHMMLAQRGYIVIAMDNRGSPCLKGSAWRKSIYAKEGVINSNDQAMAAAEVLKWDFVDTSRIAVWGWSGGGSMTLNLMFRYPDIYKTGMSVAPVSDMRTYDNIYQERYMGLPQENITAYYEGSPVNYAGNLQGNLLVVHGTGDDNVHYQNTEMLVNELIRQNKHFTMMAYPNRSHSIYEGRNTTRHLHNLLTRYLMENCPPGGR